MKYIILIIALCLSFQLESQTMIIKTGDPCGGDVRCESLTNSQAAYISASANSWVLVEESEYTTLESNLTGLGTYGATNSEMNASGTNYQNRTIAFSNSQGRSNIPVNLWVWGFKVKGDNINNARVKTGPTNLLTNIGGVLPASTGTAYYIFKGDYQTPTANRRPAFFNASQTKVTTGATVTWATGNSSNVTVFTGNTAALFQIRTTTTKQW